MILSAVLRRHCGQKGASSGTGGVGASGVGIYDYYFE